MNLYRILAMDHQRLIEMCRQFNQAGRGRNLTKLCVGFRAELGLTESAIEATDIGPHQHSANPAADFAKKTVKAVATSLRNRLVRAAAAKGIISVGDTLRVPRFPNARLTKVGDTGMLAYEYEDKAQKGSHVDPLGNPEFIELVAA